jgi:hypothetical protein
MIHVYVYCFLGALVLLFPTDAILFGGYIEQWVKLHCLNIYMFVQCYFIWRKLKKDFESLGFPSPPFVFIPIWKRDQ